MRLASLTLRHYGNFEDEHIVLDPTPGQLNLVLAPNGAGKSVLRQAFADLLYGIPARSPMDFRFGYPRMRLLAEAVLPGGARIAFGRRKGLGNTLVDAAGAPLDRAVLDALLGPADRPLLQRLFALDTALLREGGEGLLASGGALADALVSAAGGLHQARGVLLALRSARDELAPERRTATRPFYQALDALTQARRELDEATVTPEAWARAEAALTAARGRRAAANEGARDASRRIAQIERIRRVRPLLAEHAAAAGWLAAHPDAPLLPADLADRLAACREVAKHRADACREAEQRLARANDAIAAVAADPAILAEAEVVELLVAQAGAARKSQADLPAVEAEQMMALAEIGRLLRDLASPADPAAAAAIIPRAPLRHVARGLIAEHARLAPEQERLPATIALLERDRAGARVALQALPAQDGASALAALVREIRADGDPARRAADAAAVALRHHGAASLALSQVSGWQGDAAALAALLVPAAAEFERLDKARAEATHGHAAAAAEMTRATNALAEARRRLDAYAEAADLIDPQAVAAARRQRDQGWDLIYRLAFTATPPTIEEIGAWSAEAALPVAYARTVAAADALADRRAALADRIAAAAAADRDVHDRTAAAAAAEAAKTRARAAADAAEAAWAASCTALGLAAATPIGGVREFIQRREAAIRAAHDAGEHAAAQLALAARHESWRARLATLLSRRDDTAPALPALLAEAELALQQREKAAAARAVAADRLRAVEEQLAKTHEAFALGQLRLADWTSRWAASQAALGRPADEAPDLTGHVLELYALLAGEVAKAASLAARSTGMAQDIARFAAEVAALTSRLDPSLDAADPTLALRTIQARLQAARSAADHLARAGHERQEAEQGLATAQAARTNAQGDLDALIAAAGAADEAAAEARIALSTARATQSARRGDAAARLHEAGDGLEIGKLCEEVASIDVELAARGDRQLARGRGASPRGRPGRQRRGGTAGS